MPEHARLPLWQDKSDSEKLDSLHQLVMDLYRYQLGDMLERISTMLDNHQTDDQKERHDIVLIQQLIQDHPNILNMNCEVGHFTASAMVVDVTSSEILLHFHKRLNRWLQVGGHADYETDMAVVALREAQEETGLPDLAFWSQDIPILPIDCDVHTIPQNKDFPEHLHLDFRYILTTRRPDLLSSESGESTQFKWLTCDEALSGQYELDDSLRRLIQKTKRLILVE